jgi:DNA-binding MarR family transcriptional regulator
MTPADQINRSPPCPARPDDPAVQAWVGLVRAYHRIARRLEQALDGHGLSLAQFEVLAHLHFDEGMTQNDLAQRLLVTKGNVCGLIDRLQTAGLVQRRADPADRRANRLVLTAAGRTVFTAAFPAHLALIREMLGGLRVQELRQLHDLPGRLAEGGEAERPG